jgi:hypothetical protein
LLVVAVLVTLVQVALEVTGQMLPGKALVEDHQQNLRLQLYLRLTTQ